MLAIKLHQILNSSSHDLESEKISRVFDAVTASNSPSLLRLGLLHIRCRLHRIRRYHLRSVLRCGSPGFAGDPAGWGCSRRCRHSAGHTDSERFPWPGDGHALCRIRSYLNTNQMRQTLVAMVQTYRGSRRACQLHHRQSQRGVLWRTDERRVCLINIKSINWQLSKISLAYPPCADGPRRASCPRRRQRQRRARGRNVTRVWAQCSPHRCRRPLGEILERRLCAESMIDARVGLI